MGTTAYAVLIGATAGIGLMLLILGVRRGPVLSTELLVGLLSVTAGAQILATLRLHSSTNVEEYAGILHGSFSFFGIATLMMVSWIVSVRTGLWHPWAPLALSGVGLLGLALNALTPGALIVDEVTDLREVHLFGEAFVVHTSGPSSLQPLLVGFLAAITGYIGMALIIRWREATHRLDPLMVGIAVAWTINLWDILVDEAVVNTSYLAPFGLVALVGGLAIEHANVMLRTEGQLSNQSATLENVVAARTAALKAAHDDILKQLGTQNRSALRLAELSEMFLSLNSVTRADEDVEEVLGQALACLGQLVDATEAHLTWHTSRSGVDETLMSIDWNGPGIETAADEERVTFDRQLSGGELDVGRLTIRSDGGLRFTDEHRRLAELTAQYLGGFLARLELESSLVSSAVDRERHRIARDLHDSLSQRLYAAAFNADVVSLTARSDGALAAREAAKIRMLVLSALAEIRTLLFDLQPEVLNREKLTDLVTQLCNSVAEVYQRRIDLVVMHDAMGVPAEPKIALYRIVQESLGNALRHSDAPRISVAVDVDATGVGIEVEDDGIGFDPEVTETGHGLRNMRQRAAEIGAILDVTSSPGGGTTVRARWHRNRPDPVANLTDAPSLEVAE